MGCLTQRNRARFDPCVNSENRHLLDTCSRTQIFPGVLPLSVPLDRVEESAYFHSASVSGLTRLSCKIYTLTPLTGPHIQSVSPG